jgi:RsiW-degrading membrane proteinase PrsW (M82 family)
MSDLNSLPRGPYLYLILGIILLFVGLVSTCTGVVWARFGRVIYRAEQPREFWEDVVTSFAIGVCLIGYFLYLVT